MSKILKLQIENVKRLQVVEITPDGNMVQISGENGAGKSSVLDSIWYLLGGQDSLPGMPVRKGQEKASISAEIGETTVADLIVKRTFSASGGTSLVVSNKDGLKYPSPQAVLDKLVGTLSFDPLEFARNKKEQAATLKKLVGLDFAEQDKERAETFNFRTGVNRDVKALESRLAAMPEHKDVPAEEVSTASILADQAKTSTVNASNSRARADAELARKTLAQMMADKGHIDSVITAKEAQLKAVQKDLSDLRAKRETAMADIHTFDTNLKVQESNVAKLKDEDLAPFGKRMDEAEVTNAKIRANAKRADIANELKTKAGQSEKLTAKLAEIDAAKSKAITTANYPIPGLGFTEAGEVTFDGIPFDQASTAEQTRVSVAIGLALNPKLRVLLIRDGSLLDEKSMALMAEMAGKNDAQVWIERVGEGGAVAVVIEDGRIKAK